MIRSRLLIAATLVVCLSFVTSARASFIPGFSLLDHPDIHSSFIEVNYDATTGILTADGFALEIAPGPGIQENITNGSFSLTANIDQMSGNLLGGSISIGGDWSGFGSTLLTGSILDIGFSSTGGNIFQFLFEVTGGDLAIPGYFGPSGSLAGVILTVPVSGFTGDWTMSFSNPGNAFSDTAPIPGPGAGVLLLLASCLARRRRR